MSEFLPSMAEGQAIGLCWLARQKGLPDIAVLRMATTQMHELSCGWCEYPSEALMQILRAFRPTEQEQGRWWGLPNSARRAAIRMAQGIESAA